MKQQSFDDLIRQKVNAYEAPVPADAWDNIMAKKKKKRRFLAWWMMVVLIGGIGFLVKTVLLNGHNSKGKIAVIDNAPLDSAKASSRATVIKAEKQPQQLERRGAYEKLITNKEESTTVENHIIPEPHEVENGDEAKQEKDAAIITEGKDRPATELQKFRSNKGEKATRLPQHNVSEVRKALAQRKPLASKKSKEVAEEQIGEDRKLPALVSITSPPSEQRPAQLPVIDSLSIADTAMVKKVVAVDTVSLSTPADKAVVAPGKKRSAWMLEATFTPFISLQQQSPLSHVERMEDIPFTHTEFRSRTVKTSLQPGLGFGIALKKKIGRMQLGVGVQYAQVKEEVAIEGREVRTNYVEVQRLSRNGQFLVIDSVVEVTAGTRLIDAVNSYKLISLPVYFQYQVRESKLFTLSINAAAYFNLVRTYHNSISGGLTSFYRNGSGSRKADNSPGLDLYAGLRFTSKNKSRLQLFAEPGFRYGFSRMNTADMVNIKKMHQAGLSIGVVYSIK